MLFTGAEISAMVGNYVWPFVRIAAFVAAMPVFASTFINTRIRLVLAIALTIVTVPLLPEVPQIDAVSINGVLLIMHQVLIGVAMGAVFHMVFAVFTIGGQIIAMQMGLGFATMIDPVNGSQAPVLSMFYILLVTLFFFLMDGHLAVIGLLVDSFRSLPIGLHGISSATWWSIIVWGSNMFSGAIMVSLPAVTALLLINMSLGVIGRAAPQLNIFAVGFSITITAGFYVILVSLPVVLVQFESITLMAFDLMKDIVGMK
ncbi:MAG: flagellar biosynthetic protein FliR [Gammaproteobacteria bacterium]|nr:flagellar biosynthetic protein FliR [Gammaproteobacteria bacterium]